MSTTGPDDALAVGIEVAHAWAEQDRLDPHRPTLPQVVAEAIERRAASGRRATDGADRAALLDLLSAVDRWVATDEHDPTGQARAAAARARRHLARER